MANTPFTRRSKHEANVFNIHAHDVRFIFLLDVCLMFASLRKRGIKADKKNALSWWWLKVVYSS